MTDPVPLAEMLERHRGRRGMARLRRVLASRVEGGVRIAEFERRFWRFVVGEGLPLPETNVAVSLPDHRPVVDCLWRAERLIVELDSRAHHLDPLAFEADRVRDAALVAGGWRVVRVTWKRLHEDPAGLAAQLRELLGS